MFFDLPISPYTLSTANYITCRFIHTNVRNMPQISAYVQQITFKTFITPLCLTHVCFFSASIIATTPTLHFRSVSLQLLVAFTAFDSHVLSIHISNYYEQSFFSSSCFRFVRCSALPNSTVLYLLPYLNMYTSTIYYYTSSLGSINPRSVFIGP